jgi:beta-lactamase regulating signal transducer with metallopeptidase domain
VVSEGLVAALPSAGLACVLAHEREHARRRDALRALLARACSWPHPPRIRRALLDALRLASERACDEAAASRLGDRLLVAETILAVERLARRHEPPAEGVLACAFGESDVAPRVEGLLAEPAPPPRRGVAWAAAAVVAALGLAAAGPLHHATEHLLRALLALF